MANQNISIWEFLFGGGLLSVSLIIILILSGIAAIVFLSSMRPRNLSGLKTLRVAILTSLQFKVYEYPFISLFYSHR